MDVTKRQQVLTELKGQGFSITEAFDILDRKAVKTAVYLHKPSFTVNGAVVERVGTKIENQPSSPEHMMKLSTIGRLPWPPSEACRCKACRERDWNHTSEVVDGVELALYVKKDDNPPLVSEVAQSLVQEVEAVPMASHRHKYGDDGICRVDDCGAERQIAFKKRSKGRKR